MKPYSERTPDTQYQDLLRSIVERGVRTPSQSGTDALTLIAQLRSTTNSRTASRSSPKGI